jgi:hypothetical protein
MEVIIRIKDTPTPDDPDAVAYSVEYRREPGDPPLPTQAMHLGCALQNTLGHIADEVPPRVH